MVGKMKRKMPIGIQDFENLIKDGYVYVDKTERIHQLVTQGKYYFLSRPRRFGKSLLISTLEALFLGKREVFKGLAIDTKPDIDWAAHPVLRLDLNAENYNVKESLDVQLNIFLGNAEKLYGGDDRETTFGSRFSGVIRRAYERTGRRVVILVDEYDKPMLQAIGNPDLQEAYRSTLKGFYGALKSMDAYIRFAILTGVTKFSKVSVFSDLNNLNDISMDAAYADICGITEAELLSDFKPEISSLATANGMTEDECISTLRIRYDGYHFEENAIGMYNPFSVINTFSKMKFGSFWFETGTPTYLVNLLLKHSYRLEDLSHVTIKGDVLNSIDSESQNPIPVIYQSGYLTIKGYDPRFKTYILSFPNEEVEEGFVNFLMPFYLSPRRDRYTPFAIDHFVEDVEAGDTAQFVKRLRTLFADTPYELIRDLENHYQNVLWLLFKMMGFYTRAEYHTSEGRIDLVVKTPKFCYVMEFKLDGTAQEALDQISDRNYTLPFALDGEQVVRLGINFSKETKNIDEVLVG